MQYETNHRHIGRCKKVHGSGGSYTNAYISVLSRNEVGKVKKSRMFPARADYCGIV